MTLGESIKKRREELKLSQECVADRLGVSRQAVSKWETGQSEPTASNLIQLADILEISLSQLVEPQKGEEEPAAFEKAKQLGGCNMEEKKEETKKGKEGRLLIGMAVAVLVVILCLMLDVRIGVGALVGIVKSATLGDSSVSYDTTSVTQGTADWGDLNGTTYGQMLANRAKLIGAAGSYAI